MSTSISVEHLAYNYPGVEDAPGVAVFEDLNLTVEEGTFTAVLGSNGCGKSTLAKHFNSILLPCGGKVYVNGMDTSDPEKLISVRRAVGMVFQNPDNQIVATVVEEDVAFGLENLGIEWEEMHKRVKEALTLVNMYEFRKRPPHLLSGGQKQRVAIAGILAMEPQCIILDEPTAMLDPVGRNEVIETIMRLNREKGITIILITHYMEEAARADRVVVLDGGKVVMDDVPEMVFEREKELSELGLDVPQAAALSHRLREKGINLPEGILTPEKCAKEILKTAKGK